MVVPDPQDVDDTTERTVGSMKGARDGSHPSLVDAGKYRPGHDHAGIGIVPLADEVFAVRVVRGRARIDAEAIGDDAFGVGGAHADDLRHAPLQAPQECIDRLCVDTAALGRLPLDFVGGGVQSDIDFFEFPADVLRQHPRETLGCHLGALFIFAEALVQRKRHHAENEYVDQRNTRHHPSDQRSRGRYRTRGMRRTTVEHVPFAFYRG